MIVYPLINKLLVKSNKSLNLYNLQSIQYINSLTSIHNIKKQNSNYNIENFLIDRKTCFDIWNKIENGDIMISLNDIKTEEDVGFIRYKLYTGQICYLFVEPKYRKKGISNKLLELSFENMKQYNINEAWITCKINHYYWSKVFGNFRDPVHITVSGYGYYRKF
jgi:predicted acetyltransferase